MGLNFLNADAVASVNGLTGQVVLTAANLGLGTTDSPVFAGLTVNGKITTSGVSAQPNLMMTDTTGAEARFAKDSTNYIAVTKKNGAGSQVKAVDASGTSTLDFDAIPSDGSSSSQVRFGRNTPTSSTVTLAVYMPNTANIQHNLASSNAYVNAQAGNFAVGSSTSNSKLTVAGPIATAYVAKTAAYTVTASDSIINCTSGSFNVTLPTAVGIAGREYIIKNSGSGAITVATTSAQTIDGAASYSLATQNKYVRVMSDGANWIIVSNN